MPGSHGSQRAPGEKRPERCQQRPFPALAPGLPGLRQAPEEKGAFTAPVMQRGASSERGRPWRSGPWGWGGSRGWGLSQDHIASEEAGSGPEAVSVVSPA